MRLRVGRPAPSDTLAERNGTRRAEYRTNSQYQLIDTVLIRLAAQIVVIVGRLTYTLTVQTLTAAPFVIFTLTDSYTLNEMILGDISGQNQTPYVVTARLFVMRSVFVDSGLQKGVCLLFAVLRVLPIVRMRCVHNTCLQMELRRVFDDRYLA